MTRKIKSNKLFSIGAVSIILALGTAVVTPAASSAYSPSITKGTTTTYGVLAGTTITNTGATSISGSAGNDVGLSPGSAITGIETVTMTSGTVNISNPAAVQAKTDLEAAYLSVGADTATASVIPTELSGQTLSPGSYKTAAGTFENSGSLILDGGGDANAVFIFLAATTVTTTDTSTMTFTRGAQACNVYWQVGSSATIDGNFVGHVYALTSIAAVSSARIDGQLLARNGAVTLDTNVIVNAACDTPVVVTPSGTTAFQTPPTPQDSSITGVSTSVCTTTEDYTVNVSGNFPRDITNISINGRNIPSTRWTQTATNVAVNIPASTDTTFTILLYNGLTPMLAEQVVICSEAVIAPVETATKTGGELPVTGSNGYNYLLAAGGLGALGAGGYFLRRRSQI